ncbi:MAG TPA: FAD-dependent monooxygenase [Xanthobacteraceae bacterium]|nr:FAD-dependent monooxygenase [Xanthobacteraceae bacterium]
MVPQPAKRPLRVAIVGGGIGGLAAACALRQRGIEVEVFERSARLEEVGAGLQIGPNGVKVLRALGLEDELMRNAFEPLSIMSIKWDEGRLRFRQPLKAVAREKYGAPYMTAHRADLHNLLRRAAGDTPIRLGTNCIGAETVNGTAVARFADGTTTEADVVIGADGIRSAIRAQHFGADRPRFTEMMAWRAIVPMECVPTRVGPGGSVTLERGEYFGWIGPNGHVICYPIGVNGDQLNIFGGHVTEQWVEESWSVPSSREELMAAKAGWNEALLEMFRHVEQVFKWGIYDRDPLPQWTRGRVTLLGDAAHPTMPTLAQGANMAIEDGYVLARLLARHGDDVEAALKAYVVERKPRTDWVTLKSREQFANNRKASPPPFVDRTWLFVNDVVREEGALQPA